MGKLVKAKDICQRFSISKRTLYRWKNEGLPSIQLSYNMVRYDIAAVTEWFMNRNLIRNNILEEAGNI
ncbi:hypothetical protein P40081_24500 [Paenibacillus sp. FSL P4-0081]|uniref:helix-turn-helix transcriptional regulator n=1 Tax=Paenibacillus sp. FSL P4-0081 TaxID=1536769 RepID=UPI0004F6A506|nr:hypothetical protein [Paenibacillus sp. FSL P4-0081]AIQ30975.1 hypothetical protein P40081_24500 [Paenibacillus sp. FSL P4-0081]